MIEEEFRETRAFKYPEEYDCYDDEEENIRIIRHAVPDSVLNKMKQGD